MHRVNALFICAQSYGASKYVILKKLQGVQSLNYQNMFLLWFSSASWLEIRIFTRGGGYTAVERKKIMHPLKIDQKRRFPSDNKLMCNSKRWNVLIDPKSVSPDIKLILKVFEINKIWVKPYFFRPHPARGIEIVFWPALSHFLAKFLKKGIKLLRKTHRFKKDMYLIFLKHHPCITHH